MKYFIVSFLLQFGRSFGWVSVAPNCSETESSIFNSLTHRRASKMSTSNSLDNRRASKITSPSAHADGVSGCVPHSQSRSVPNRSRDLLDSLPLFETVSDLRKSASKRTAQRFHRQKAARQVANDGIRAIQALSRGSVKPSSTFGERVKPKPDFQLSRQAEDLCSNFFPKLKRWVNKVNRISVSV